MKRMKLMLAVIVGLSAFITSCTKDPLKELSAEESRIYVTSHDSSANFSSYRTFYIADSAGIIKDGRSSRELTASDQAYIEAVKNYMQQRGYSLIANKNADLGINVNRIYNTSTGLIDYTDYWSYYGGYWDPLYWGYPGYGYYVPYAYGIYQVTEGVVSIDMFDLRNAASTNKINLIWNGLIRGEGIFNNANADASVKALFDQSQYLQTSQ